MSLEQKSPHLSLLASVARFVLSFRMQFDSFLFFQKKFPFREKFKLFSAIRTMNDYQGPMLQNFLRL
jgi:hypothetical protein